MSHSSVNSRKDKSFFHRLQIFSSKKYSLSTENIFSPTNVSPSDVFRQYYATPLGHTLQGTWCQISLHSKTINNAGSKESASLLSLAAALSSRVLIVLRSQPPCPAARSVVLRLQPPCPAAVLFVVFQSQPSMAALLTSPAPHARRLPALRAAPDAPFVPSGHKPRQQGRSQHEPFVSPPRPSRASR